MKRNPSLLGRRRLAEDPGVRFVCGRYQIKVESGPAPEVSCYQNVYYSGVTNTSVDTVKQIIYSGHDHHRKLFVGEWVHEVCHLVGHPPWEEPMWSDEFVILWALELAIVEDLVRRGFYGPEDLLYHHANGLSAYVTEWVSPVGKYRPQAFSRALGRSREICQQVGLLTKANTPTYRQAKWDSSLEAEWKKLQQFDSKDVVLEGIMAKAKVWEEITLSEARKIAKKRGLDLDLLRKACEQNGSKLSGQLIEIPGDEEYVELSARTGEPDPSFWLHGIPVDIHFVRNSV
jgi:hypothetical protein